MRSEMASLAFRLLVAVIGAAVCALPTGLRAQTPEETPTATAAFVPPPRTIVDITAILDQEKPNAAKVAQLQGQADAPPPPGATGPALAEFYFKRAQARALLGRVRDAIADGSAAVSESQGGNNVQRAGLYEQFLIRLLGQTDDYKRVVELVNAQSRRFQERMKGRLFSLNLRMLITYLSMADLKSAEGYAARNNALLAESRNWPNSGPYRSTWTALAEEGNGRMFEMRGRLPEAERAYARAVAAWSDGLQQVPKFPVPPVPDTYERGYDWNLAFLGRVKTKQGRYAEGEADIRRALLSRLAKVGKYHPDTAGILAIMAWTLGEQGRRAEAEKVAIAMTEIYRGMGYPEDSQPLVQANSLRAAMLSGQGKFEDAVKAYDSIEKTIVNWDAGRRSAFNNNLTRVNALLATGSTADVAGMAKEALAAEKARSGENSFNTAVARGFLAMSYARTNRRTEAAAEFKTAIPVLIAPSQTTADEDGASAVARELRIRLIVESYIGFLARSPNLAGGDVAEETFRLADVVRGHGVERALAASSARAAAKDPALAELARKEQDLKKQVGAALGALNNLLALPTNEREPNALKEAQAQVAQLQSALATAHKDLLRRFPDYGNLVDPAPVSAAEIRAFLRPDEVLISFYFGRFNGFAWAVPKEGPIRFAALGLTARQLSDKVTKLREALEPQAAMITDIPPFDLQLAYELYAQLLKPVEAAWRPAKSLIVVTNGALGLLPLSLLPTQPAAIAADAAPLFAAYRNVPWLARSHAVTVVPSAGALRTLRQLPAGNAQREKFIAFGDPLFNAEQAAAAGDEAAEPVQVSAAATRGVPLKRRSSPQLGDAESATLGQLPRLPDTAQELKSIALALEADPTKVLNLGKEANERKVKTTDLSKFRIIAFATHGLVPGELDGLTQPALALTAPNVADVDGDGLLTMEEILALKLDADWVVLSACNTGAGAGAGAEAASGLGRAFFYAGTRALLVTNWSVHSASARELVTDLFRRQAADPKLSRGEALRQAMMALADGPGFTDEGGKTVFAYAHPLFWAPYTIIGDGGGSE